MIRSDGGDAFITIVAGPATQWAEVRETMRQDGLIEASRSAPDALDAMMNAPGVAVAGHGGAYPAIILTPTAHGIRASEQFTEGTAAEHGTAPCRETGCQYVSIWGWAVTLKK